MTLLHESPRVRIPLPCRGLSLALLSALLEPLGTDVLSRRAGLSWHSQQCIRGNRLVCDCGILGLVNTVRCGPRTVFSVQQSTLQREMNSQLSRREHLFFTRPQSRCQCLAHYACLRASVPWFHCTVTASAARGFLGLCPASLCGP